LVTNQSVPIGTNQHDQPISTTNQSVPIREKPISDVAYQKSWTLTRTAMDTNAIENEHVHAKFHFNFHNPKHEFSTRERQFKCAEVHGDEQLNRVRERESRVLCGGRASYVTNINIRRVASSTARANHGRSIGYAAGCAHVVRALSVRASSG